MVELYLNGKIITNHVNWSLFTSNNDKLLVKIEYKSGKCYTRPYEEWTIVPTEKININQYYDKQKKVVRTVEDAIIVGEKYFVVKYPNGTKQYILNIHNVD